MINTSTAESHTSDRFMWLMTQVSQPAAWMNRATQPQSCCICTNFQTPFGITQIMDARMRADRALHLEQFLKAFHVQEVRQHMLVQSSAWCSVDLAILPTAVGGRKPEPPTLRLQGTIQLLGLISSLPAMSLNGPEKHGTGGTGTCSLLPAARGRIGLLGFGHQHQVWEHQAIRAGNLLHENKAPSLTLTAF